MIDPYLNDVFFNCHCDYPHEPDECCDACAEDCEEAWAESYASHQYDDVDFGDDDG